MFNKYNDGWIEVVTGPMFSGKTSELIKRSETLLYAKKKFLIFKPNFDNRWDKNKIISRRPGNSMDAISIENSNEIFNYLTPEIKAIVIDETQFFGEEIVKVVQTLAKKGLRVIVGGLDMDFKMRPFNFVPSLLAIAEFVTKLSAVCFKCGRAASFSKRITGSSTKTLEIGDESYEARCRKCF